ncbi:ATP-binding protein [Myroides marinus]|uniref:ATP-binding protein n=1 Tax=Myroides marinus TaxID=703342 RepID=UPI002576B167|nr:ATP-binding protein [Myroides marinus]MDM1501223.1 ATP-binding protein [Myroides marinus]
MIDFLSQPTPQRIKREIENICDSYNHPWDFLAELCQNSIDAINVYKKRHGNSRKHKIEIIINSAERSLSIKDTGIGFNSDTFKDLLAPHGTDKKNSNDTIGEKGVGLTYTIFISNKYEIKSKSLTSYLDGFINGATQWKNSESDNLPLFEIIEDLNSENDLNDTFTYIKLSNIEDSFVESDDLFNQSTEIIEYIIRSKTAIGYTKYIYDSENYLDIEVELSHIDKSLNLKKISINPSYILPTAYIDKTNIVNIQEFKETAATLSDEQKTKRLQGKCLFKIGSEYRAGRNIKYYVFFAPSRNLYKEISEKNNLEIIISDNDKEPLSSGGIYLSTKGMPTGVTVDPPKGGEMGYWPNFFILFEDDSLKFDLGRKSIPARTAGLFKDIAKNLFSEFRPFIEYVRTEPPVKSINATIQQYEKNNRFSVIENYANLNLDDFKFTKHPNGQEAAVVALFHELLGADLLKGYHTYEIGYKMTYDFWGKYVIDKNFVGENYHYLSKDGKIELPFVAEFKYKGEDILSDFEADIKFFNDIDLIVCWDIDETKFAKKFVTVEPLPKNEVLYFGSNFKLSWPGSYNLGAASEKTVICLRQFILDLIKDKK